jgi:predicted enzyme related to lactoylglutathione lyase
MNNGPSYFEIQADDTARARAFYNKVFGWKFTEQKGLPTEYWRIQTASSMGGLLKRPAKTPPMECGTNAYTNSMEVKNFDETAKKILDAGGVVAMPKFAIPGLCYQGYFLDTENNVFGIFEPNPEAK